MKNVFKKLKLSTKLVMLIVTAIVLVLVVVTSVCLVNMNKELKRIAIADQETRIRVFWDLLRQKGSEFKIVDNVLMVDDYVVNGNFELPDKLKELCDGTATIFMLDERVSTNVMQTDGTRAVGTRLQGEAYNVVFTGMRSYRGEATILGEKYLTAYDPIRNSQGKIIGVLYTGIKRSEFFGSFDRLKMYIMLISLGSALMIGLLAIVILRNMISKRLARLISVIDEGENDLTMRLEVTTSDEISAMAQWFNRFNEKLDKIISSIRVTTGIVTNATHEVAAGSQGLSMATQEQAAAIEEVASTIEEMTASIKTNASNAEEGRAKTASMVHVAGSSEAASQELLKAMGEISDASRKVGDIIVTVNEVAFQTNLLALNAAVEAARAGEHGKGFAIVAEEVRSLAQRSAQAANEIKNLIGDTINKVNAGDEIVKRSVESLKEIISHINEVSQTMDEIAASSSEQAVGIDEVNRAITQIENTTQQNAATVEQLANTAESLSMEASDLAESVKRFVVSESADNNSMRKADLKIRQAHPPVTGPRAMKPWNEPSSTRGNGVCDGFEEF